MSARNSGRPCAWSTSATNRSPSAFPPGRSRRRAEISAAPADAFGAHSSNENFTPIYYNRILFLAHFNAGVRAVDVRDPFHPKEIGYYIPATTDKTDKRCVGQGAEQQCKVAIQTNNVEVDDRGYIYAVDRANTGMHILTLTGSARQVADFSRAAPQ